MSIDLKRKEIRETSVRALNGSGRFSVSASASRSFSGDDLPMVRVSTPESEETYLGGPPPLYRCKTALVLSLAVSDSRDPEGAADTLACEVHRIIAAAGKEFESIRRTGSRTEVREGGRITAVTDIFYEVTSTVKDEVSETHLSSFKGMHLNFGA